MKKNKKLKRRMNIYFLIIFILLGFLAYTNINIWNKTYEKIKEKELLEPAYEEELKNTDIKTSQILKYKDPDALAKEAREKHLLTGKGEVIIKIVD